MTSAKFDKCYPLIRVYEGGNVDDPLDPGGRTSRGITQRVYTSFRRGKNLPNQDVYKATEAEVGEIYFQQYWVPAGCESMPVSIALSVFDFAVNSGVSRSVKTLQRCLPNTAVDGQAGMITLQKVNSTAVLEKLINDFFNFRMAFYKSLSTYFRFGKGWKARAEHSRDIGLHWEAAEALAASNGSITLNQAEPLIAQPTLQETSKADEEEQTQAPVSVGNGTAITAAGALGSGLSDQIKQITDVIAPISSYSTYINCVFIALTIIGVGFTIYAILRNSKNAAAAP